MLRFKHLFSLFVLTGLVGQIYWSWPPVFGWLYILWFAKLAGPKFFAGLAKLGLYLIISGSVFYYLYDLGPTMVMLSLLISAFCIIYQSRHQPDSPPPTKTWLMPQPLTSLTIIAVILIGWMINILFDHQTVESIRSLWSVVPENFLWLYGLTAIIILWLAIKDKKSWSDMIVGQLFIFISLAAATIVYKLGYSFDGFIHQATETAIAQNGLITPKTPYYIGQYSLTVILNYLLAIKIIFLDTWLVPISAVVGWTWAIKKLPQINFLVGVATLLLLPLSALIGTTPYGLAIVITTATIILSPQLSWPNLITATLATIFIHPLVGLPLAIFTVLKFITLWPNKIWRRIFIGLATLGGTLAIPIAFVVASKFWPAIKTPWTLTNLNWNFIAENIFPNQPNFYAAQNIFVSLANLWQDLWPYALIGLFIAGWPVAKKSFEPEAYLLAALITWANALILKIFIANDAVIVYERFAFADRLWLVGWFLASPIILLGANRIANYLKTGPTWQKIGGVGLLAGLLVISFYNRYPHHDFFNIGRFYSLSSADHRAVEKIDQRAGGNYAVLANQMVAASAVQHFGFDRSHTWRQNQEQYFYPLPTVSPLYQYYLKMIATPDRKIIDEIFSHLPVDKVYFVVNAYWHDSPTIIEQSQKIADDYFNIDETVWVFEFKR